jgi:ABC-2 type transport system permease protein
MKRYLKIAINLMKLNFERDIMYRINAILILVSAGAYTVTFILGARFTYDHLDTINGISYKEILALIILTQIWWYLNLIFSRKNFQFVIDMIHDGTLDMFLLKPVNIKYLIPFFRFDFRHVAPIVITIIWLLISVDLSGIGLIRWVLLILSMFNTLIVTYSTTWIFAALNLSGKKDKSIFDISLEVVEIVRLPLSFFPAIVRVIFTYLIPLIIIVNPAYLVIFNKMNWNLILSSFGIGAALFIAANLLWDNGLKRYASVG